MPSYTREIKVPGRSAQELYDKVSEGIDRFVSKSSVGKYELDRDPGRRVVSASSTLFTATLYCEESTLRLEAKLSLLAAPFRGKLDEGIDKWIAKTFGL
jgi:hypothetical protein